MELLDNLAKVKELIARLRAINKENTAHVLHKKRDN